MAAPCSSSGWEILNCVEAFLTRVLSGKAHLGWSSRNDKQMVWAFLFHLCYFVIYLFIFALLA